EPLSVAENMFLGNLMMKGFIVNWKGMRKRAQDIVDEMGMDIDINAQVSSLTVAKKQVVEIMHAINNDSKILIMDEPSAVLTDRELESMFRTVNQLREKGITIIYISHRLEEVFKLCDNVSVLRDGLHINTLPVVDVNRQHLIHMMVGREMGLEYPKEVGNIGDTILEVKNLSRGKALKDISFSVRAGEVFGISGLVGAGRTELARAILGIDPIDSGEIFVRGKKAKYRNFADAIHDGLGLIPEDRKLQGLVQIMSVKKNTTLVNLDRVIKGGVISNTLEDSYSKEYTKKLNVSTPTMETEVQYLSGGNQQKVVIAKWLFKDAEILFLDEPTRGIDVGAKSEIYRLINQMVNEEKTVIMISSEMPEILGMCDRIMVMHEGCKMGEMDVADASQEKIMALCV
ncbi:MAG: sugar ABC transporter ATP-binding protein, partial [Clostridiales bacterium]|nr:sugar ABC transporter ATP-binding protein [Clostridiales bacterium]